MRTKTNNEDILFRTMYVQTVLAEAIDTITKIQTDLEKTQPTYTGGTDVRKKRGPGRPPKQGNRPTT